MPLAVAALSHAPSFGNVDPGGTTMAEIEAAIGEVRSFVESFDPRWSSHWAPITSTVSCTR